MKQLWTKLETLPDLDALQAWPLVPVRGRQLRRIHKSSQVSGRTCTMEGTQAVFAAPVQTKPFTAGCFVSYHGPYLVT